MNIVVSSPHAGCIPSTKRMCDLAASSAAKYFCSAAGGRGLKCLYIEGNELRKKHDLNRRPSRGTPFRKTLTSVIKHTKEMADCIHCASGVIVVDVHSFPNYWMAEAGDINFFKPGELPPEIVILQGPMDMFGEFSITMALFNASTNSKIRAKLVRNITVNDIMNESSELEIPAVLLEFNEGLLRNPERMAFICGVVAEALYDISRQF